MNFYNPYYYSAPTKVATGIFSKLKLTSIINGTSKFLNFANQTIPIFRQVTPVMKNAKTMFKLLNEFKKNDITPKEGNGEILETKQLVDIETTPTVMEQKQNFNMPTFFA